MTLTHSDLEMFDEAVKAAEGEGYEFAGATPPGNPWARAYANDVPLLLAELRALKAERA